MRHGRSSLPKQRLLTSLVIFAALAAGGWVLSTREAAAAPCVVRGFLDPPASDAELQKLIRTAEEHPRAGRVRVVTAAEALENRRKQDPALVESFESNPFPSMVEVVAREPADAPALRRALLESGADLANIQPECGDDPAGNQYGN